MKDLIKENKGITLIALIITIIIMLILVAVSVTLLIQGNIIENAKTAKDKWEEETDKEKTIGSEIIIDGKTYGGIDQYIEEVSGNNEGKFTINDLEFEWEPEMTWEEWCDSEYNIAGLYVEPEGGIAIVDGCYIWKNNTHEFAQAEDIVKNEPYNFAISCFTAGTKVMYSLDGKTKNIEEFKQGDIVISYDIFNNKYYEAEVKKVMVHDGTDKARNLADIVLEDGTTLTCTPNHPIYTENGFKTVEDTQNGKLQVGDKVKTVNGYSKIIDINIYEVEPTAVYNLDVKDFEEVNDNDSYDNFIANNIVVHNKCEPHNVIVFGMGGKVFVAEEGWTWEDWCNSEYNIDGFCINTENDMKVLFNENPYSGVISTEDNSYVHGEDTIISYGSYLVETCFPEGTQVMCSLDGKTKNIEEFKPGDTVISYDILNNKYYEAEVKEAIVHEGIDKVKKLADIVLEDGTKLTCTPNHPIYTEEGFKTVEDIENVKLQPGDKVKTVNGYSKIIDINTYEVEPTTVYNLDVKDFNEDIDDDTNDTYIVNSIVVHNLYSRGFVQLD